MKIGRSGTTRPRAGFARRSTRSTLPARGVTEAATYPPSNRRGPSVRATGDACSGWRAASRRKRRLLPFSGNDPSVVDEHAAAVVEFSEKATLEAAAQNELVRRANAFDEQRDSSDAALASLAATVDALAKSFTEMAVAVTGFVELAAAASTALAASATREVVKVVERDQEGNIVRIVETPI